MIDELSLGLAPVIIEQLVGIIRQMRDDGVTDHRRRAVGERRAHARVRGVLHGEGPDPLPRPDRGAAATPRRAALGVPRRRPRPTVTPHDVRVRARRRRAAPRSSSSGCRAASAASAPSTTSRITVGKGEIVGIIGPNGAGKTTLFDLVSGFTPLDGGRIVLGGRDVTAHDRVAPRASTASAARSRTAACSRRSPSSSASRSRSTAGSTCATRSNPRCTCPTAFDAEQKIDARVDELVELLGLEAYRSKFVHELSTGSRRIVELGCLIAHRPTVILLDEPSSGIAQRETEALGPVLLRLRDQLGASLLVIEHDMPLIATVSDRLVAHGPRPHDRRRPAERRARPSRCRRRLPRHHRERDPAQRHRVA